VRRHLLAFACVLLGLLGSTPARAVERQHHLGLGPQLAMLSIDGKSTMSVGGGGVIHYAYGLSDAWNLTVEAGSAIVAANQEQDLPTSPRNRPSTVDHASAGVSYVIDIIRFVPSVGLAGSIYRLAGGQAMSETLLVPGVAVSISGDYQLSRRFAIGAGVRQHLLLGKLDTYPSYTTAVLRFEVTWGY
jgi:hypothetical protein